MLRRIISQEDSIAVKAQARKELANALYGMRIIAKQRGDRDEVKC